MRQALELSITTQPSWAAYGANLSLALPPAEKRAMSMPLNDRSVNSWTSMTSPRNFNFRPIERDDANRVRRLTGNSIASRQAIIWLPTAPVAPATAT